MSLIENIKTEFESENIEKGEAIIESPPFSLPSKASIAKVGDLIRQELDSEVSLDEELLNEALTKLVIYRYYHSYNISIFRNLLNRKIKRLNLSNQCIISSRVKRAQSIFLKLKLSFLAIIFLSSKSNIILVFFLKIEFTKIKCIRNKNIKQKQLIQTISQLEIFHFIFT